MAILGVPGFPDLPGPRFYSTIGAALLVFILLFIGCGRRSAPPITSINDEPPPPAEGPHHAQSAFGVVAEKVRPALVVLATFDEHGGLVANEYSFFISANGDLLAEKSAMNNAASAMAKGADGRVYDIRGTYVRSTAPNFIVLKTKARNVPHLDAVAARTVPDGARAAVVLAANTQPSLVEGRISGRKPDAIGEWLTFVPDLPKATIGAPVIDEKGELIGVVAQRGDRGAPAIFRANAGASAVVAQIAPEPIPTPETMPEEWAAETRPSPEAAERSKSKVARSDRAVTPAPVPESQRAAEVDLNKLQPEPINPEITPRGFFIRMNPNWHIHARDRPQPAGSADGAAFAGKLIYKPAPQFLSKSGDKSKASGSGSYRLLFNSEGRVTDVQVARSAGSSLLDDAAISTLRGWRAEPGRAWTVVVPVNFGH
jgi:protein TonB